VTKARLLLASLVTIAAIGLAAVWTGAQLPAHLPLPVHWGINGQPDRLAGKWVALLMPGAIAAAVTVFFYWLPAIEPRRQGLERSSGLYFAAWSALLMLSLLIELAVISVALRWSVHGTALVLAAIGILFVTIGNQLGKSRSMYLIGFRTPWTLASEEVWMRTHRLAGKLMVVGGVALLATAFLRLPSGVIALVLGTIILAVIAIPILYSYFSWRRERAQN
jgi:uncharacterized membrane protein